MVAPQGAVRSYAAPEKAAAKAGSKRVSSKASKKKDGAGSDAGSQAYVYEDAGGSSLFASLDQDMQDVAKVTSKYPKSIPQCLANLNLDRILTGELLGRSLAKAR